MYKTRLAIPLLLLLFFIATPSVHSHLGPVAERLASSTADPTLDQLNGEPMVFKSYEDFLKGKGQRLKFHDWHYLYTGGSHLRYLKASFKDADGKTVNLSCEEFWGFRCNEGLYRSMPFATGEVTHICFRLQYKIGDVYVWDALGSTGMSFTPGRFYTQTFAGVGAAPGKDEKLPPALECTDAQKVYDPTSHIDWPATLVNYKKCPTIKYMLYCEHAGKKPANYFGVEGKDKDPAVWKYVPVNP